VLDRGNAVAESEFLLLMGNTDDKNRATERVENENVLNRNDSILMVRDTAWDDAEDGGDTDST